MKKTLILSLKLSLCHMCEENMSKHIHLKPCLPNVHYDVIKATKSGLC